MEGKNSILHVYFTFKLLIEHTVHEVPKLYLSDIGILIKVSSSSIPFFVNNMSFYEILNSHKLYYFVIRYLHSCHNDVTDRREGKMVKHIITLKSNSMMEHISLAVRVWQLQ